MRLLLRFVRCMATVALASIVCLPAWAHRPSESHLVIQPGSSDVEAKFDVALRDLDWVLTLDANGDGALTWGEVSTRRSDIERYLLDGIGFRAQNADCAVNAGAQQLVEHSDGSYLSVPLTVACGPGTQVLSLKYGLLFDADPQHRALVRLNDGSDKTFVLSKGSANATFSLGTHGGTAQAEGLLAMTVTFVGHGFSHIAAGFDHLLFLLLLLLPAVLRRENGRWVPMQAFGPTLREVAKVVTAFTAAHAITMSAAAMGLVSVPANLVEPAIALSLVVAAANNVWPLFAGGRWALPFALGLLHGFGFSSALADLGLPHNRIVPALVGFNVGVELGQLVLVVAVVPLAFLLRRTRGYGRFAITGGSMAIAAVAMLWFVERVSRSLS